MSRKELKRIVIFGAESTGKSHLAQALGEHFQAPVAPEYVREFWDEHQGQITAEDLDAIARGQIAAEEAAALRAKDLLICDTDLLTNVLWNDLLFPGACPSWVREEAERRSHRYALYLLCDTDLPFEPDPQRCFPDEEDRKRCRDLWRETLVSRQLPFVEIYGLGATRVQRAVRAVERICES